MSDFVGKTIKTKFLRKFLRGEVYMQQHLLEHIDCNNHSHFLEEMGFVFMD